VSPSTTALALPGTANLHDTAPTPAKTQKRNTHMRVRSRIVTGVFAAGLLASGCSTPTSNNESTEGGAIPSALALAGTSDSNAMFTFGYFYPNQTLDPAKSGSGLDATYLNPIYDRLIYATPSDELQPMLAQSWDVSQDKKTLTLHLRKGLKFNDGAVFDAAAAKLNLDRSRAKYSQLAIELKVVTDVKVVDNLTVEVDVTGGVGALLTSLASRPGMMASPASIAANTLVSNPVGIGPYKATKVVAGAEVDYVKTDNYWDPSVQRVKGMVIKTMIDDQTRLNALTSGGVSAIVASSDQLNTIQNSGFNLLAKESYIFEFFAINTNIAPFDNPDVRAAITHLIDREGIGQGLYNGFCTPQVQPWPKGSVGYNDTLGDGLGKWSHDVAQAKALLKSAGYANGFSFPMVVPNLSASVKLAEAVQSQLAEGGIKVEIRPQPSGGIGANFFAPQMIVPATIAGYTGSADPASVMDRNFLPTSPYNPSGMTSQEVQDLAKVGASEVDPAARNKAYSQIAELMVDKPGHLLPICQEKTILALDKSVSNITVPLSGAIDLRGIAVKSK